MREGSESLPSAQAQGRSLAQWAGRSAHIRCFRGVGVRQSPRVTNAVPWRLVTFGLMVCGWGDREVWVTFWSE